MDETTTGEPKKLVEPPSPLSSPQMDRGIVAQHRQTSSDAPVDRGFVASVFRDILRTSTFNGFPMIVDGNSITVNTGNQFPAAQPTLSRFTNAVTPLPQPPVLTKPTVVTGARLQTSPVAGNPTKGTAPEPVGPLTPSPPPAAAPITPAGAPAGVRAPINSPVIVGIGKTDLPALESHGLSGKGYHKISSTHHESRKHERTSNDLRHPHDPTQLGSTLIPIKLTRADGNRTILAFIDVPTSYVVEGAEAGERTLTLPAEDEFYDTSAGGSGLNLPFTFQVVVDSGEKKLKCNPASCLFDASMDGTTLALTGISTAVSPSEGQFAWIEISQDSDGSVTATEFFVDDPWDASPAFFTVNTDDPANPYIDSYYYPVAKFVAADDTTPGEVFVLGTTESPSSIKVVQFTTSNQLLVRRAINGLVGWTTENFGAGV